MIGPNYQGQVTWARTRDLRINRPSSVTSS
jgi:hypothetical protein